ncbi:MAG: dTDP-4-dehydrorhamnose 3,5-epimerase family protein [bacterium]
MIEGIKIIKLIPHVDERGFLMEILRKDNPHFKQFGQIYLTTCNPGVVKAWHAHKKQTDNIFLVKGSVKLGLYDGRTDSPTYKQTGTIIITELNRQLVQIPPFIWHGFSALGNEPAYILNIPTELYNYDEPDEMRVDPFDNDFNFDWKVKSG